LQNKGAVAGTFTVVALAAIGAIAGLAFFFIRHHRRQKEAEEVDEYFDKLPSLGQHHAPADRFSPDLIPPTTFNGAYAARDDRQGSNDVFHDSPNYTLDFPPELGSFSGSRPVSAAPGTAYAAAIAHEGPYQYTGRSAQGYDNGGTTAIGAALIATPHSPERAVQRQPHDAAYAYDPFNSRP